MDRRQEQPATAQGAFASSASQTREYRVAVSASKRVSAFVPIRARAFLDVGRFGSSSGSRWPCSARQSRRSSPSGPRRVGLVFPEGRGAVPGETAEPGAELIAMPLVSGAALGFGGEHGVPLAPVRRSADHQLKLLLEVEFALRGGADNAPHQPAAACCHRARAAWPARRLDTFRVPWAGSQSSIAPNRRAGRAAAASPRRVRDGWSSDRGSRRWSGRRCRSRCSNSRNSSSIRQDRSRK